MRSQENIPFQAALLWRVFCTCWLDFLKLITHYWRSSSVQSHCIIVTWDSWFFFPCLWTCCSLDLFHSGNKSILALFLCEVVSHGDRKGRLRLLVFKFQLYHLLGVWFGQFTWLFWFHFLVIPFYQKNKRDPPYKVHVYKDLKAMSVILHKNELVSLFWKRSPIF